MNTDLTAFVHIHGLGDIATCLRLLLDVCRVSLLRGFEAGTHLHPTTASDASGCGFLDS
ncbi:MAG: hypothetical protein Q8K57_02420 [Thiobacillus sp.]|nr:hypothetical protein [Gammaproteobacteria bacterium]MDP1923623.1 hypothetical protein [Thiobacillus sp.]MDP3125080.1 hypothetical protein [Thiobacillus sp.]